VSLYRYICMVFHFLVFRHNQYILEPFLLTGAYLGSVNYIMGGVLLMSLLAASCSPVGDCCFAGKRQNFAVFVVVPILGVFMLDVWFLLAELNYVATMQVCRLPEQLKRHLTVE
jgi:cell division protein FtsX